MVIQDLAAKTVFLDTAPLINYIEGHSVYQPMLAALFDFNDTGGFVFVASTYHPVGSVSKALARR